MILLDCLIHLGYIFDVSLTHADGSQRESDRSSSASDMFEARIMVEIVNSEVELSKHDSCQEKDAEEGQASATWPARVLEPSIPTQSSCFGLDLL